jgi:hypothetical protein
MRLAARIHIAVYGHDPAERRRAAGLMSTLFTTAMELEAMEDQRDE